MGNITRRKVLQSGLATAAAAVAHRAVPLLWAQPAALRRPNLLLLVTDDQRADGLGCSGNTVVKTPNIDALATAGVRFRESFATSAICMSSRASLLTGMYTRTHGVDDFTKPLPAKLLAQSYPRLLHENGYRTGFVGKWGVDGGEIPRSDFDYFAGYQGQGRYFEPNDPTHLTVRQTDQALDFLRGCTSQPFCLAVSFKASHVQDEGRNLPGIYAKYPYDLALKPMYENDRVPGVMTRDITPQPAFFDRTLNRTREAPDFSAATYQETMKSLYRLIAGVDQAVGKIVNELETLGFTENTVVVFTSDHGSFYGEHGFGGKWLMHEESIRTPMIIRDPRLPADRRGTVCDHTVLNVDVPATLLDLAGISTPVGIQGRSMMPLVHGKKPAWRTEWFYENHFRAGPAGPIAASEGIRTGDWKYIRYIDTDPIYEQLFDLKNDSREEKNLATDEHHRHKLVSLRSRWDVWQNSLNRFSPDQRWNDPPC